MWPQEWFNFFGHLITLTKKSHGCLKQATLLVTMFALLSQQEFSGCHECQARSL